MGWEKPTAKTFAVSYSPDYRNWKVVANKEPQGANWCHYIEAVREPAKDQPAVGTLFVPCKHCRNSMACAQIQQCEIYGASGVEARVCQDIAARQRVGIAKYGVTVEQSPDDMLRHAYEEAMDLAVYLKAELERRAR